MTPKQKLTAMKRLLTAAEIALIICVPVNTVESWTKEQGSARNPGKKNVAKIDGLYETLKPCFERLETLIT